MRKLAPTAAVALAAVLATLTLLAPAAASAASGQVQGELASGPRALAGFRVTLFEALPGKQRPTALGATTSRRDGSFVLRYGRASESGLHFLLAARPAGGAEAGFAVPASAYRLAASLGEGPIQRRVVVNDRTTVAMGYAMAQFIHGSRVAGENPGLRNAAAMTSNLVDGGGRVGAVLRDFPNGNSTSTLATFGSLANLVAGCRLQNRQCARLLRIGGEPGGAAAANTLQAIASIARNPWHGVRSLFELSQQVRAVYRPALGAGERPDAWTLALRFEGVAETMDGPGNFAIDAEGSLWVVNNYEYSRDLSVGVCGGEKLLRFTPTGDGYPGSPYEGGGLSGAGFGITFDPRGRLWAGNFGFAGKGCEKAPPSNSVSLFSADGTVLSPPAGYTAGAISWPQGTVSDRAGNIWIANCGNDSVTLYPGGNPLAAANIGQLGLERPFGAAVGSGGRVFVVGTQNATVAVLGADGKPAGPTVSGHGLSRPLGIATDSRGYVWVANSDEIIPPCKGNSLALAPERERGEAGVTLLSPEGVPLLERSIKGAGMTMPWGIAVDGDDNVWVANFSGQRLSQICGMRPRRCPEGKRKTGRAISPNGSGYGFDGLVRNTGVAVDPSGHVWVANNWKRAAIQTNPGGYQIVAYLGLAAPVETPLIGTPTSP